MELPYNTFNKLLSEEDLFKILGKKHNNIDIYRKSFVHKSYCTRKNENFMNGNKMCPEGCIPLQEESNERLEFFGDSILNLVISDYIFERFPDDNEGFLTKMRTKLVNGKMLAFLSKEIKFDKLVIISKQIEENNGRNNSNIIEDVFEAFIAAIYLDLGFESAKEWIVNVIENIIDFPELIKQNHNYKDQFLKKYQQTYNYTPKFFEMNVETNKNNIKTYTVCVKDDRGNIIAIGKGCNRKDAENNAAKNAS